LGGGGGGGDGGGGGGGACNLHITDLGGNCGSEAAASGNV